MTENYLLLNADKTEVIFLRPEKLRASLEGQIRVLDNVCISSSSTVRNLGVTFDQDLNFKAHINQACRAAYFHFRNIAKIRNILSKNDAEKRIHVCFVKAQLL